MKSNNNKYLVNRFTFVNGSCRWNSWAVYPFFSVGNLSSFIGKKINELCDCLLYVLFQTTIVPTSSFYVVHSISASWCCTLRSVAQFNILFFHGWYFIFLIWHLVHSFLHSTFSAIQRNIYLLCDEENNKKKPEFKLNYLPSFFSRAVCLLFSGSICISLFVKFILWFFPHVNSMMWLALLISSDEHLQLQMGESVKTNVRRVEEHTDTYI